MKPVIEVENLSKLYHVGERKIFSLKESWERWWRKKNGNNTPLDYGGMESEAQFSDAQKGPEANTFWALKDVSFSVQPGEVVGIIGRNGAGKSTLLKILSRITEPTSGRAVMRGRVASLLEVGTGFHPDLTGRENIYLNGAILGMRRREIDRKFDEIVAFAEVEKFIDTPVKHYSSGMYVRLAFAVAAHLEPEILLVDEVLAVGDAAFQKKCLGKMGEVAKLGRTVLFVSHNMAAVKALCKKGIVFDKGQILCFAEVENAVGNYIASSVEEAKDGVIAKNFPRTGTGDARFEKIDLQDFQNKSTRQVLFGQRFKFLVQLEVFKAISDAVLGVYLNSSDGICFSSAYSIDQCKEAWTLKEGSYYAEIEIQATFVPGRYSIGLSLSHSNGWDIDYLENVYSFEALNVAENSKDAYPWTTKHGFIRSNTHWQKPVLRVKEN